MLECRCPAMLIGNLKVWMKVKKELLREIFRQDRELGRQDQRGVNNCFLEVKDERICFFFFDHVGVGQG
jgi:hypothetical protein